MVQQRGCEMGGEDGAVNQTGDCRALRNFGVARWFEFWVRV